MHKVRQTVFFCPEGLGMAIASMSQSRYLFKNMELMLMKDEVNPADYQSRLDLLWSEAGKRTKRGRSKSTLSDDNKPQKRRRVRIFNSKSRANRDRAEWGR